MYQIAATREANKLAALQRVCGSSDAFGWGCMRMPANVKSQCMQVQIAEAGAAQIECLFGTQFCVVSVLRLDKCVPMHALMRDCANATDNQMLCQTQ